MANYVQHSDSIFVYNFQDKIQALELEQNIHCPFFNP
jgi:hypothetical protein